MTYITFLSNYDKLNYPNNEPGTFTNTLAQTIHLDEGTNEVTCQKSSNQ